MSCGKFHSGRQPKAVRVHRGRALLCLLPALPRLFLVRRQSLAQANTETQQVGVVYDT